MKQKSWVAILVTDKTEFKTRDRTNNKEGYFIMIKGSNQKEDIILANTYAHTIGAAKHIKQILTDIRKRLTVLQSELGNFNTPWYQWVDHADRKSIRKQ